SAGDGRGPYRIRICGRRRISRHGGRWHHRRTRRDRQRYRRRARSARYRHIEPAGNARADIQAHSAIDRQIERKLTISDLTGRFAVVSGGGRDVGAEICRALAAAGAKVAVNYNASKADAEAVVAKITKAGGTAAAYQADVADLEQVRRMISQVK